MKSATEMSRAELLAIGELDEALGMLTKGEALADAARDHRDESVVALRGLGWTIQDLATVSGLSVGRVHQVLAERKVPSGN